MQDLASHGHTVVAIQHAEQLAEFNALMRAEPVEKKKADALLAQQLKAATDAERPRLAVEYYAASTNTNRLVVERAADTSFVLGQIDDVVAKIPSLRKNAIDTSSAHLVGFSVGGAVSAETAKCDARAQSVVNLDGGMQGTLDAKPPSQPYLMLYSSVNDGMNDKLLPQHARRVAPADTAHLNYHDVAGLLPVLRLARVTGRIDPRAFLEERNRLVREWVLGIERGLVMSIS
jgi:dienelactone hydrolase